MKKLLLFMMIGFLFIPATILAKEERVLPSGMPVQDLEQTVDHIMEKYIGKDMPGIAVAIVQDGEVALLKGYGLSDMESNIPVDPEKTIFEAASVSKLYTWTAVMQLAEQGKLDLDADILDYLPNNFLTFHFDEKVTMLHLMNHTAGFEAKAEHAFTYDPNHIISLEDWMTNEQQPKQVHKPGTITSYSNYGTDLAGYIIQRVSGQPFEEYMEEHVLGKLQMRNSSFEQNYEQMRTAYASKGFGYIKNGEQFEKTPTIYINEPPAGALHTTASDMALFMLAHLNQQQTGEFHLFQNKETLRTMHEQSYSPNPQLPGNAHGFWERFNGEHRLIEHTGNSLGYTAMLSLLPEQHFGMAFLTNVANESSSLRIDLYNALVGVVKKQISITSSERDELVQGTYRMARGVYSNFLSFTPVISNRDVTIKRNKHGGIHVSIPDEEQPIHYVETAPFFYERVSDGLTSMDQSGVDVSRLAFEVDQEQKITKMSFGVDADLLPVNMLDRSSTNIILVTLYLLTFLLYTLFFLMHWFRRIFKSRKGRVVSLSASYRYTAILAGTGMLIFVNNIILFLRATTDHTQSMSPLRLHIAINWLLPLAIVVCGYCVLKNSKQATLSTKIFQFLLIFVSILFSLFLLHFRFLY
ncbi:CubicO group peptidase (beta-lactamase class C family) [Sporosarcina luteola]|nr:CubicO group peptidase (beta-lactamase class C family) [Sporosarcina luteola]